MLYYDAAVKLLEDAHAITTGDSVTEDDFKDAYESLGLTDKKDKDNFKKVFKSYYFAKEFPGQYKTSHKLHHRDFFYENALTSMLVGISEGYILYGAEGSSITNISIGSDANSKETGACRYLHSSRAG